MNFDVGKFFAGGALGATQEYNRQQKEIRDNQIKSTERDAEYRRKESFAKFGYDYQNKLARGNQVLGQDTETGQNVYADQADQLPENFRTTADMATDKEGSGMWKDGKELTNSEVNALPPEARSGLSTTKEWLKEKAQIQGSGYASPMEKTVGFLDEQLANNKISQEEYDRASRIAMNIAPKVKEEKDPVKLFKDSMLKAVPEGANNAEIIRTGIDIYHIMKMSDPKTAELLFQKNPQLRDALATHEAAREIAKKMTAGTDKDTAILEFVNSLEKENRAKAKEDINAYLDLYMTEKDRMFWGTGSDFNIY